MAKKCMYQMDKIFSKRPKNIPTFSIPRPSKIYPSWDFWFENKPSGNPGFVQLAAISASSEAIIKSEFKSG
jgi:hypothetical protein